MYYYHVLAGSKHIDLVAADSEEQAVAIVLRLWGNPLKYSNSKVYKAARA